MTIFNETDKTVFVERIEGVLVGIYACKQDGYAEEEVLADDPEVFSFMEACMVASGG